jgi:transcriptional regulator with XRE-family HTH domain
MPTMLQLGKAIKLVRTAQGLSLGEVAKQSKVGMPFLSLLESGQRHPSLDSLRRIASALGIPSEALVLLAQSQGGSLNSADGAVLDLAESVRRLADAEESLREKLRSHK